MRTAKVKLTAVIDTPFWVNVKLTWPSKAGSDTGYWGCLPGYLVARSGYWKSDATLKTIDFYDDDDKLIGYAYPVDVGFIGYPLEGLKGTSCRYNILKPGGKLETFCDWKFMYV